MLGNYARISLVGLLSRGKEICAVSSVWATSEEYVESLSGKISEKGKTMKDKLMSEIRTFIRERVLVELTNQSKRLLFYSSGNGKRITAIESREKKNARVIDEMVNDLRRRNATLDSQIQCGVRIGHHFSVEHTNTCRTSFRCVKCELSYGKDNCDLNEGEKELLTITLKGKK